MVYFVAVTERGNATNVRKKIKRCDMKTVIIKEIELPLLPPKGWKKKVAEAAGCSQKTVYNALRGNIKGPQANKVMEAYKHVCGQVTKTEVKP